METDDGFRIMAVLPHSPAEAAGLQVGDMILSIDEDPAADLRANGVDDRLPMKIEVLRDGELIPVEVKGEPPHGDKPF
ncbi:MAG: PDZ domain-containing protein [Proteobacteria bacterium]|nr:PDZ domain-containing protein [Pseudomonadota bacterium]